MTIRALWPRASMIALAAAICVWLVSKMSVWGAFRFWALGVVTICGGVGLLMHTQAPGKVSIINHLAGWTLPWGFTIGRGKLLPLVIESSIRWVLLGIAIFMAAAPALRHPSAGAASTEYRPGTTMTALVALSWLIDGAVVLRIATVLIMRTKTTPLAPGILGPTVGISLLMAVSLVFWLFAQNAVWASLALLLAGGPIVLIGGGYGLFVLLTMIFGRKLRWN